MNKLFEGSGVALVTPFVENGDEEIVIDYGALKWLVDYHIDNNTDAIIICGTTGEAPTLTDEEHLLLIKRCVEYANGRIPVIAGTGSNDTKHAVRFSKEAESYGANGLLCVIPYYNKTNQEGLKLYYKRISDAVNIPVIMYNVPSRTGVNILPETAIEIAKENENIVAIKEASGKIEQLKELSKSDDLILYSGNDDQIYETMECGGKGVISVLANIFPKETHDIVNEYLIGNRLESLKKQKQALELIKTLFSDVNPIPIKKAVELEGLCNGILREPLIELDNEKTKRLKVAIDNYKNNS